MRVLSMIIATVLWSAPAFADCMTDARKAFAKIETSGPFRYEIIGREGNLKRVVGALIPETAHRVQIIDADGALVRERITIGKKAWSNDGLGWDSPANHLLGGFSVLGISGTILAANCARQSAQVGRQYLLYEIGLTESHSYNIHSLLVNVETGFAEQLISRRETDNTITSIATFEYDPSIRITPPAVDLEVRRANANRKYQESVQGADPHCREEFFKVARRGIESGPFRYKTDDVGITGIYGFEGVVIPPASYHYKWLGAPRHGGGIESIVIHEKSWHRS